VTPEKCQKLTRLFGQAVELPIEQRASFAAEARADDLELRDELLRMLAKYQESTGSLDDPMLDPDRVSPLVSEHTFSNGEVILDRFRIVRFIKSGGMGEVFAAYDLDMKERVALKTIRVKIARNRQIVARFRSEIQLARRVSHPNVCRIYDLFAAPRRGASPAATFLTMEYLEVRPACSLLILLPVSTWISLLVAGCPGPLTAEPAHQASPQNSCPNCKAGVGSTNTGRTDAYFCSSLGTVLP
jgi:hypothetical protein